MNLSFLIFFFSFLQILLCKTNILQLYCDHQTPTTNIYIILSIKYKYRQNFFYPLFHFCGFNYRNYYRHLRIFFNGTRSTVHRSLINSTRVHVGMKSYLLRFGCLTITAPYQVPIQYVVKKILDICITGRPFPSSTFASILYCGVARDLFQTSKGTYLA